MATYDGYERSSYYIEARDGTKLAADVFRPTRNGVLAEEELPLVWMHTPYNRRTRGGEDGGLTAEKYPGYALRLVPHGYNVAVVDFRGLYASYGKNGAYNNGAYVDDARMDAYDVTEHFAHQPWCNGRVGMWGCSATGGSQMQAATTTPPSLKAIFPMSCPFDGYDFGVPGGVEQHARTRPDPVARDSLAAPVDGPNGQAMLAEAVAQHRDNIEAIGSIPFRDSISPTLGVPWWIQTSPYLAAAKMREAGIGIYAAANWNEAMTKYGAFFIFKNLESQSRLLVGPCAHCDWKGVQEETGVDLVQEELRFFDYWLKDIDNGIMAEPRVTYYTYNAPAGSDWRHADTWPLPAEVRTDFHVGESGLALAPSSTAASLTVEINNSLPPMTTTTGPALRPDDEVLHFLSTPLDSDMEVTGHSVLHLWLSTDADDLDAIARLEDVAPDGSITCHNVHGTLRASHRRLSDAPYNNFGLPWHSHKQTDAEPLERGKPTELVFDLLPISYVFRAGHQLRLTLCFADTERGSARKGVVSVLCGPQANTRLTLPVIPT